MNRGSNVLVAGDLYIDLIFSGLTSWPAPGTEVFATGLRRQLGGGTSITACGLAKLGVATEVLAVVGAEDGAWVIEELALSRVRTNRIEFHPTERTAVSIAATTACDRAFLSYAGANGEFASVFHNFVAAGELNHTRHIHLAYAPDLRDSVELFEKLRSKGVTLSLDVGWHENWLSDPRAFDILRKLNLFFPNEPEGQLLTGSRDPAEMLRVFDAAGVNRVALKLGAAGSALLWDGEIIFSKAVPVAPVDTTGAGDCFNAGFLYAWLKGEDPRICLQIANLCGALSTEAYGGIAGFPAPERIRLELAEG